MVMITCPNCKFEFRRPLMQDKVKELADGTRTANDIAELLNTTPEVIRGLTTILRKRGETVSLKAADKFPGPNHERDGEIFDDWGRGATIKQIAAKHGISSSRVGQILDRQYRMRSIAFLRSQYGDEEWRR